LETVSKIPAASPELGSSRSRACSSRYRGNTIEDSAKLSDRSGGGCLLMQFDVMLDAASTWILPVILAVTLHEAECWEFRARPGGRSLALVGTADIAVRHAVNSVQRSEQNCVSRRSCVKLA
jgi:hypothetical protein